MDTSSVLKAAWTAVEAADLPENIHQVAFREAVRLIAPPAVASGERRAAHHKDSNDNPAATASDSQVSAVGTVNAITISENALVQKVSKGTGADAEALGNLIYVDSGVLHLNLPGIKLGRNIADRTRTIAAVFTVVRSFGLDEDDTSVELVREEAQRLKCYDSANFSSQLKALPGYVIKGVGTNRRIQVKSIGVTAFPHLVAKLTGEA